MSPWAAALLETARGGHLECRDMHMRMDARGTGHLRVSSRREGVWSACDMHEMDARGTCTPARSAAGGGIWSASTMRAWLPVNRCEAKAGGGHLECLRYAHENGCASRRDAARRGSASRRRVARAVREYTAVSAPRGSRDPARRLSAPELELLLRDGGGGAAGGISSSTRRSRRRRATTAA